MIQGKVEEKDEGDGRKNLIPHSEGFKTYSTLYMRL